MKKTFIAILSLFMLVSCGNSKKENKKTEKVQEVESVVEEESLVRNLDYKTFVKKVWDIETYPDSFAYKSKLPCMIDFYADWCGPCKALSPVIDEIALERMDITVGKVNVDTERDLAEKYKVRSIPTMVIFKGGKEIERMVGFLPKEEILSKIKG